MRQGHESPQPIPVDIPEAALLEGSKARVPFRSIQLANAALERTFPQEFGRSVPKLTESDIWVCTDASISRFNTALVQNAIISVRSEIENRIQREVLKQKTSRKQMADHYSQGLVVTVPDLPGKKILYPESEIGVFQRREEYVIGWRIALDQLLTSKFLIHESFHRVNKDEGRPEAAAQPVRPDDPIIDLSFERDRFLADRAQDAPLKDALNKKVQALLEYARFHNPAIYIDGARVMLFADDTDGKRKMVTMTGYDLNEATVEELVDACLPHFYGIALREYGGNITRHTQELIRMHRSHLGGSSQLVNLPPEYVANYYAALKAKDPKGLLKFIKINRFQDFI